MSSIKKLNLDALKDFKASSPKRASSPKKVSPPKSPKKVSPPKSPKKVSPPKSPKRTLSPRREKSAEEQGIYEDIILKGSALKGKKNYEIDDDIIKKAVDLSTTEKIVLKEHQVPHVEKIKKIYEKHFIAFDMSTMGAGKTYTTSKLSLDIGFKHVIVICPVSVESKWWSMKRFGVQLNQVLSYQTLRSIKNKNPKHGLLERIDIENEESGITKTIFTPTEKLINLIDEGLLFVVDEAQHIKNKNDQFGACQAIIKQIMNTDYTGSRILFLSGTPIDKEEHAVNMMQAMNIIKSNRLHVFIREESRLKLYGALELKKYIEFYIGEKGLDDFFRKHPWRVDNVPHICYLLFQQFIKPAIASAMPSPPLEIDCKNGYYKIVNEDDKKALIKSIAELQASALYNERTNTLGNYKNNFGAIMKSLVKIESAKVNDMIRTVVETLEEDPNCKVGVFLNYRDNIDRMEDGLLKYKPLVMTGSVSKDRRQDLISKFQEPNTKYRVIIATVSVASTGIDLDDKHGDFPRFAFASPNYNILDLHQLTRRFVRLDSKSPATFRFFYGLVARKEMSILNALSRKSDVMKDTLEGQVSEGIKFPGEYEDEFEYEG